MLQKMPLPLKIRKSFMFIVVYYLFILENDIFPTYLHFIKKKRKRNNMFN